MAKEKRYPIKCTRSQLEALQRVLELAACDAGQQQLQELEAAIAKSTPTCPHLVAAAGKPPKLIKPDIPRGHPMPLRSLRVIKD
jgi:hypothetical protein